MKNVNYRKLTTSLLAGWFSFSLIASGLDVFKTDPGRPPIALGLAVLGPIVLFLLWFGRSKQFREFVLGLNPRTLTLVHAWRIGGFVFLVLYTYGILPGTFALPAGWGDIAIGATAPLVAFRLANFDHRKSFVIWQALGILDLVAAIALGTTASLISPLGIVTAPMTVLPLSLIPTFAVPLLLILHIMCIAQARNWDQQQRLTFGAELPSLPI